MTAKPLLPLEVTAQASDALAWLRTKVPASAQLTGDTRRLARGDVFLAYVLGNERLSTDGRPHIAQAIAAGAGAILYEADGFDWTFGDAVPHLALNSLHQLAGPIAAGWYGNPARGMAVTGITGTNGKTSCSQWLARCCRPPARRARPSARSAPASPMRSSRPASPRPMRCNCRPAWLACMMPARARWRWKCPPTASNRSAWRVRISRSRC